MMLKNKNAVIYGAGGAIGRNLASVAATAGEIAAAGGTAEAAQVDTLAEGAVEGHIAEMVKKAGTVDISFNAITPVPQPGTQGLPIAQFPVESFIAHTTAYMRSYFLTARAAARRMVEAQSGVMLIHTPEPARLGEPRSPCPSQGSPK